MGRKLLAPAASADTDYATKSYVDSVVAGLSQKAACRVATAAALPSNTYLAGVLTGTGNGALTVDGVAVAVANRVLVKDEVTQANNGIYVVTATGGIAAVYVLTRSSDMNEAAEIPGAYTNVEEGTANTGTQWEVDSSGPFTIGTTAIVWTPAIQPGTGLTRTGNTLAVSYGTSAGTAAQGNDSRIDGAVQKSLYDAQSFLVAVTDDTPAVVTVAASRFLGRKASGDLGSMSVAEAITLLALTSTSISDFTEAVQDIIGALLVSGVGIDFTYNDAGNTETAAAYQAVRGINDQTASYTLVLGDAGKHVRMNVATANNLTVPLNSSVAFPINTVITGMQIGAGQTTIVATGGVTLNATPGLKIAAQNGSFGLVKVATDTWDVIGRLAA